MHNAYRDPFLTEAFRDSIADACGGASLMTATPGTHKVSGCIREKHTFLRILLHRHKCKREQSHNGAAHSAKSDAASHETPCKDEYTDVRARSFAKVPLQLL